MIKKPTDLSNVSDATIVNEVTNTAAPVTSSAEPETLKPVESVAEQAQEASTIKARMQQAAAAAAMNAARHAVNNAFRPRPNWAFAMQSSAHMIALGFGSGLMRPAPGTWGTIFGWVTFNYFLASLSSHTQGLVIAAAFALGVWACGAAGKALGVIDHGAWVWDEVVAFWLVLWLLPASVGSQLWAFLLFRFFDIVKPAPIRQLDAQMKNGFGVMFDDIVAAGYTLLVIALWARLFG
jgi:phosphatidylglycerophosphatase A